jgi:hypothetical protein
MFRIAYKLSVVITKNVLFNAMEFSVQQDMKNQVIAKKQWLLCSIPVTIKK